MFHAFIIHWIVIFSNVNSTWKCTTPTKLTNCLYHSNILHNIIFRLRNYYYSLTVLLIFQTGSLESNWIPKKTKVPMSLPPQLTWVAESVPMRRRFFSMLPQRLLIWKFRAVEIWSGNWSRQELIDALTHLTRKLTVSGVLISTGQSWQGFDSPGSEGFAFAEEFV